jgi:hypothetical protein
MRTESSCTVFKFNGKGFDRYFVGSCHWQENKARNVLKSGDQNADSVTVYIPADYLVMTPDESYVPSERLLANADIAPQTASKDIIIKGKCSFIFDNSNDRTVSESLKKLRSEYQIYTVMSIDRKLYGSKNLQHIKISAR